MCSRQLINIIQHAISYWPVSSLGCQRRYDTLIVLKKKKFIYTVYIYIVLLQQYFNLLCEYNCNNPIFTGNPYGSIHRLIILMHKRPIRWTMHMDMTWGSESYHFIKNNGITECLVGPVPSFHLFLVCIRAGLQAEARHPAGAVFVCHK